MDGREHQVSGERALHRDVRGLGVADLADHDHVRILAQDRAQRAGEGHADLLVGVHLVHGLDVVLDRILDRHQVAVHALDLVERGVERGGLAAPGGSRDQHHAVGLVDRALEGFERRALEPEVRGVARERLLVEQTQHHLLAERGGERRDADVHLAVGEVHGEAAVLRQQPHRDVEVGEHLDARNDRHLQVLGRLHHLVEHAVDAVAHHQPLAQGLDVDVARARLDRLGQHQVHEPHHRRVLDLLAQGREVHVLADLAAGEVEGAEDLAQVLAGADLLVEVVDRLAYLAGPRDPHLQRAAGERTQVVERDHVERIGDRDLKHVPLALEREQAGLAGDVLGHQLHRLGLGVRELLGGRDRQRELLAQQLDDVALVYQAEPDQGLAQALARVGARLHRLLELVGGDASALHQQLAEATGGQPEGEGHRSRLIAATSVTLVTR